MTLKATCWSLLLALLAVGAPAWAAKVDVCHIPPGDPSNLHTITISEHALQAHLAHGDFLGDCSAAPCPCMRIPQFNELLANANFCAAGSELRIVSTEPFTDPPTAPFAFAESSGNPAPVCGVTNPDGTQIVLPVTAAQADACFQLIADAAASRGVSCEF